MSKLKAFVKWTDIALSLREMFDEIKGTLKDHESELQTLQKQNMLLLQQIEFQNQVISDLKQRISTVEARGFPALMPDQKQSHGRKRISQDEQI